MKPSILYIITIFFIFFNVNYSLAQLPNESIVEMSFKKATALLDGFQNDKALIILNQLVDSLEQYNALESPLGIRIQFRQAEALEKDQKDDIALEKLIYVKRLSKEKGVWDAYANSSLILARLYEKIGLSQECFENLIDTRNTINGHALDSIYPLFSIRYSSYHRIYDDRDSALFYANEVLRTAPLYKQLPEEGVGHMLLGMLVPDIPRTNRLFHYKSAANIFEEIGDYAGHCYMISSVAGWYFQKGNYKKALIYNDSTLMSAYKYLEDGHEERWPIAGAYKFRAEIYKQMGKSDSAWFYLNKGYQIEVQYIHQSNNEKVMQMNANLNEKESLKKISEQEISLKNEKKARKLFLGLSTLFLGLIGLLSYFYFRLRNNSAKTIAQSSLIEQKNKHLADALNEQKVLQAEVHHRVKNNLQIIISLIDLQKEDIDDQNINESLESMSSRIYSMAAIHEILYHQENISTVIFFEYVNNLCSHFSNFSDREDKPLYTIGIGEQHFNLETCMPLGIMLTELITNSLKYGRKPNQKLQIIIGLQKKQDTYCLLYKDNGPGFKDGQLKEREGGLGTYLLKSMSRQLLGNFESINEDGVSYKIYFKEKKN